MKFTDPNLIEKIRREPEPSVAKKLGRCPGLRDDWEEVKVEVMKEALLAKFTQHEGTSIAQQL